MRSLHLQVSCACATGTQLAKTAALASCQTNELKRATTTKAMFLCAWSSSISA